jgi:UDP-3-O-[3-hydroxymyristoyl] glucosamine N-acyltransferase
VSVTSAAPAAAAGTRTLTAAEVAARTGGTLVGDGTAVVSGIATLSTAVASDLSFCGDARYGAALASSRAGVLLVTPAFRDAPCEAVARVIVDDAFVSMLPLLGYFRPPVPKPVGVHPTAILGRGVTLGADVAIGPHVVIGPGATIGDRSWIEAGVIIGDQVRIGEDVRLHPHVTLYAHTVLGDRVEVHANSTLGSDGFGYRFDGKAHQKVPHAGRAVIEHDVEIGANCTVDRGTLDDTVIGAGSKLDNMVHVGHNCRIGRLCLLMAQVGLAGSTTMEDGVILAGQSGVGGHATLGKGARLAAKAGAVSDVPAGETWSGFPARNHRDMLRRYAALARLTEITKDLERMVAEDRA